HCGYTELTDAEGRPFGDYDSFCQTPPPFGLGMTSEVVAGIIGERVMAHGARERVQHAARHTSGTVQPLGNSRGRQVRDSEQAERARQRGVSGHTQHKLDRTAKLRPDLLEQVQRGELSVHAAALAAGIVKTAHFTIPLDPHKATNALLRRFTSDEIA